MHPTDAFVGEFPNFTKIPLDGADFTCNQTLGLIELDPKVKL